MTVKDVVKISATFLGREKILEYLNGKTQDVDAITLSELDTLTRLTNLVVYELACTFLPMVKVEHVYLTDGKLYYSVLAQTPLEIVGVMDENMVKVDYIQKPQYLQTALDSALVEYTYFPSTYGLEDKLGYDETSISAVALGYGVTAEFCLTEKRFEESVMWHERYVESVNRLVKPKNARVKKRRFL